MKVNILSNIHSTLSRGKCFLTERFEDQRPVLPTGAGESQPGQSDGVQRSQAVLGLILVSVERMPGSEGHLSLRLGVPPPGVLLVTPAQPPALLSPGDGDQGGDEGGEEVTN